MLLSLFRSSSTLGLHLYNYASWRWDFICRYWSTSVSIQRTNDKCYSWSSITLSWLSWLLIVDLGGLSMDGSLDTFPLSNAIVGARNDWIGLHWWWQMLAARENHIAWNVVRFLLLINRRLFFNFVSWLLREDIIFCEGTVHGLLGEVCFMAHLLLYLKLSPRAFLLVLVPIIFRWSLLDTPLFRLRAASVVTLYIFQVLMRVWFLCRVNIFLELNLTSLLEIVNWALLSLICV